MSIILQVSYILTIQTDHTNVIIMATTVGVGRRFFPVAAEVQSTLISNTVNMVYQGGRTRLSKIATVYCTEGVIKAKHPVNPENNYLIIEHSMII